MVPAWAARSWGGIPTASYRKLPQVAAPVNGRNCNPDGTNWPRKNTAAAKVMARRKDHKGSRQFNFPSMRSLSSFAVIVQFWPDFPGFGRDACIAKNKQIFNSDIH
jgi:hypothetical protein